MARPLTATRRYAEAAFELATGPGEPADAADRWSDELRLAAAVVADERVVRILDDPTAPLADRERLLERLLSGRVAPRVFNLARLLVERGRIELLPAVAREYGRLLALSRGTVTATVTSARPLEGAQLAAIRERVEAMTGASVDLETALDPSLIGGLTVRVGDRLLDASVRGRLERLRDRLVAGAR